MPRIPKPCAVCATAGASYACPKCRVAYCSVACCKRHKADCGGAARAAPAPAAAKPAQPAQPAARGAARHVGPGACDDDRNALSDSHRRRLSECAWLRDELRSEPSLRALLRRIEAARDPAAALSAARSNDPRFAALVDAMLVELGVCAVDADGRAAFEGAQRPLPPPGAGRPPRPLFHPVAATDRERAEAALRDALANTS